MEHGGPVMFAATRIAGFVFLWWDYEGICDEDKETKYVGGKSFLVMSSRLRKMN